MLAGKNNLKAALRIDDIGASTKLYERYSKSRLLNFGPLKDRRLFGAWGPYREMTESEWHSVFEVLQARKAKLTVAVTAAWVEYSGELVPFPEKFPEEARALKSGQDHGLIEIANHGLTHCVVEGHQFRPRLFGGNRSSHREFWDWLPAHVHLDHLSRAQGILKSYFGETVTTLVPPGNVFSPATIEACDRLGLTIINCSGLQKEAASGKTRFIGNENVIAFHDRELVLQGAGWLTARLERLPIETEFCFVREL